jgi:hypothetical protein
VTISRRDAFMGFNSLVNCAIQMHGPPFRLPVQAEDWLKNATSNGQPIVS